MWGKGDQLEISFSGKESSRRQEDGFVGRKCSTVRRKKVQWRAEPQKGCFTKLKGDGAYQDAEDRELWQALGQWPNGRRLIEGKG